MKKIFFTLGIALVTLSCNFENVPTETVSETKSSVMKMSEMKTPEMKAFDPHYLSGGFSLRQHRLPVTGDLRIKVLLKLA